MHHRFRDKLFAIKAIMHMHDRSLTEWYNPWLCAAAGEVP